MMPTLATMPSPSLYLVVSRVAAWCLLLLLLSYVPGVAGHGRLMEPPSRSSMWRFGFDNPVNYDDNQLFCGGYQTQWEQYAGKCGLCGDPWPGPRDNEPGGKYANGIITRNYKVGHVIDVLVQLTAAHKGYFEFRLCEHNDPTTNITQACLDRHLLVLASTGGTRYMVPSDSYLGQDIRLTLRLPPGLSCSACVLQWKYNSGNSWGYDFLTGRGCIGCGPQEQFYGCSDIAIGRDDVALGVPVRDVGVTVSSLSGGHWPSPSSFSSSGLVPSGGSGFVNGMAASFGGNITKGRDASAAAGHAGGSGTVLLGLFVVFALTWSTLPFSLDTIGVGMPEVVHDVPSETGQPAELLAKRLKARSERRIACGVERSTPRIGVH